MQDVRGVGPIPKGIYRIGPRLPHHPTVGLNAFALIPASGPVVTLHRSGFYAHGDNSAADHTASHGCIVSPPLPRLKAFGPGGFLKVI